MSTPLRANLPPLPPRMRKLRVDARGYPVPFFVAWVNGAPDFRAIDTTSLVRCVKYDLCWLCGEPLGRTRCMLIGPMCTVNRTTAEPPEHVTCADFAVKACPFLTTPEARRNTRNMPTDAIDAPGIPLDRNPGVIAQWVVERKGYKPFDAGDGRALFRIGEPVHVVWWAHGRHATRAEVMHSIETGLPALREICGGDSERAALERALQGALKYLPPLSAA